LQIDLEFLRRHYASLSDEALRAVDTTELVEAARACHAEELARRGPASRPGASGEPLDTDEPDGDEEQPDWIEEAACACSFAAHPGTHHAPEAANARDVLKAAGIPSHLDLHAIEPSTEVHYEYRLMVPGKLNLQAAAVLDKEIFNVDIEAGWRTHFQALSDRELRAVDLQNLFGGLLDRIERVTRAYEEEVAARRLTLEP